MTSGIYQIRHLFNDKRYIGSSINISKRWSTHKRQLARDIHINRHLQRAWRKDGEDSFVFEIVEECESMDCLEREQSVIDKHSWDQLYNINPKAESRLGSKHSSESKLKMSRAKRGRAGAFKGVTHSKEAKEKMRQAKKDIYKGDSHPHSKLTTKDVLIIKRALRVGISPTKLAIRFQIGRGTIYHIRKERQWSHVKL